MKLLPVESFSIFMVSQPTQEKEGEGQEDEDYANSEAPLTAQRGFVARTPVLVNLLPTLVAETDPTPAVSKHKIKLT